MALQAPALQPVVWSSLGAALQAPALQPVGVSNSPGVALQAPVLQPVEAPVSSSGVAL